MSVEMILVVAILSALLMVVMMYKGSNRKPVQQQYIRKSVGEGLDGLRTCDTVLSPRQVGFFNRLVAAFPEHHVLGGVAFTALLESDDERTMTSLRKRKADFVICGPTMAPELVLFLDDPEVDDRQGHRARVDAILRKAGLRFLRYVQLPETEVLLRDVVRVTGLVGRDSIKRVEPTVLQQVRNNRALQVGDAAASEAAGVEEMATLTERRSGERRSARQS